MSGAKEVAPPAVMIHRIPPGEKVWGPDWGLPSRTKGLGSGDAPTIMGAKSFNSLYNLWASKTGKVPKEDISGKPYIEWGNILERPVAEKYARSTGRLLIDRAEDGGVGSRFDMRYSPDHKWMNANLDYEIADPGVPFLDEVQGFKWEPAEETLKLLMPPSELVVPVGMGTLEVKTGSGFSKDDWIGEPPLAYQMQAQHQMGVTGATWCSIAVLLGGSDYRQFDIMRDDDFIALLIQKEEIFWEKNILGDVPPEVDGHDKTREAINAMWPKAAAEKTIELSDEATTAWNRVVELRGEIGTLYKEKKACENKVAVELKDAQDGLMSDGSGTVRYPVIKKEPYSVEKTSYRSFFFRKPKADKSKK